ncbi:hypothetical protein PQO01_17965 [Lentisphaera marina]|uniref:hypothetical protein n=1 Tax=Lentisphaera marina TaxID=1111041 RepID=UPI00236501CC|nr:hypothetical protein [Lentisphaera marina]MDD7986841.1 hypothetical protein [Lentisphaera marina]
MDFRSTFYALFIALFISSSLQAERSSKTDKYLSILIKRPSSDYLFDKFYSSWLENATGSDLEKFLDEKFAETKEPIYRQIKAYYLEAEGSNHEALDIYNDIISTQSSASLLFRRAKLQMGTLEFEKAIADLKLASEISDKEKLSIQINKLLGKIYIRDEKKELGLKVWLEMAEKSGDEDLLEEVIELMIDEGLFAEARAQIDKLLEKSKDTHKKVTLTLRLGDIYRTQGNKNEALKKYTETLESIGTGSWLEKEILSQIEQVFRSEDNLHGLAEYYNKIIKDKSNNIEILKRQATILYELGEKDKSLKAYQDIVKLTPMSKENKEIYAQQLSKAKKFKEALELTQALIKQYPDDKELYISQAKLYHELKNNKQCSASLFVYINKDLESEYSYMRAANLLRNFELKEEAKKTYIALIAKYPESREGRMLHALNLYELDEKEAALKAYSDLAKTDQINDIQRLISTLNTLKERESAFKILMKQHENFKNDYKYNEILLAAANGLKNSEVADKAATLMLNSASTIKDITKACNNIIFAAKKANKLEQVQEELENKDHSSDKETILLSTIYDQMGEIDSAFELVENKLKQDPKHELFLEHSLYLSKKNREWEQAIATLTSITQLSSKHKANRIKELVSLSLQADKNDDALKWIAIWKKTSASSTNPYIQEAAIYRKQMDYEKSAEVLKKAMFKFPDNKTLPRLLAQDLSAAGKNKSAKSVYWRMANKSEDLGEKLALVRSIIQLSQSDDSVGELTQKLQSRLENNPKSIFPPLALAELHRHSGYYEDRRKFLLKAIEIKPNDINLLKEIARIEEEEGQYDRALESIKKIISLDKKQSQKSLLVQFYMRNGEEDLAFEQVIENSGGKNMPVEDVIKTAISLIKIRSEKTRKFIAPYLLQYPEDYRISFLYAIAMEEQELNKETAYAYMNVLNATKEVIPLKKASSNTPSIHIHNPNSYYKELAEYLPPDAIDLIKNSNSTHRAYSYKQQGHGRSFMMSPFASAQTFPMPQKLSEIEPFILPHLSTIYLTLEAEEQDEVVQKLESLGVKYAKLKLTVFNQRNRQRNQLKLWEDFADLYKGDKTFEALYAYMFSIQIRTLEDFNKHYQRVKNHNTLLAVNMTINAANKKLKIDAKYLKFAIDTLLQRDPAKLSSSRIASTLLIEGLDEESMNKLKKLMLDTYLAQDPKKNSWGHYQIIRALVKIKDYASMIIVINHEDESYKNSNGQVVNPYYFGHQYGRGRQQAIIAPIKFPPNKGRLISPFLRQTFSENNYYNRNEPIDRELLSKEISRIKSPASRLFIADYCEDEKTAKDIINSLAKDNKSLDQSLLIAGWQGKHEQIKEVVEQLTQARKLCSKKSEHKLVNGALVYYIELSENDELNEQAKLAAERLIALRLSIQEKGELASSLDNLGFNKLADTLDKEIDKATSRTSSTVSSSGFSSSRRNVDPTQKVRELFKKGEEDKALAFAVREFRKLAKSELNYSTQRMGNSSWQLKNLMRLILEKRMATKFTQLLSPQQNDTFSRTLLERALAHELLKESDKAIQDYQTVLEKNKDSKAANLRLAFLIAEKDPQLAKVHFLKATGKNINFIGPVISSIISSMYNKASIYDIYPIIVDILKESKVSANQDQYWINNILSQMENSVHTNEFQLPHMFDQKQTVGRSKNKEKAKAVLIKREKSYIEMCKVALKFPSTSSYAFGRLEYLISQGRLKSENSFLLAKQVLTSSSDNQYYQSHTQSFYVNNMQIEAKSAEDVYVHHVMTHSLFEDEKDFIKGLNFLGTRIKEKIEKSKPLYECEPKDFIATGEKFLKDNKDDFQFKACKVLINAHESRKLDADITPLIMSQFKSDLNSTMIHGKDMSYLGTWTKALINNKPELLANFFDQMAAAYQEAIEKLPKQSDANRHNPMNHILSSSMGKVFGECINSKLAYTIQLIQMLNKHKISQNEILFRNSNLSYSLSNIFRKNNDLYDDIKVTPLFADLANFDAIELPKAREKSSILREVTYNTKNNSQLKKSYLAKLKKEEKQTFGIQYLVVLLENNDAAKVYTFLDTQLSAFKQLPKDKQEKFLSSLEGLMKQYPYKNKISSVTGAFRDFEQNYQSSHSGDKLSEFLKRKVGNDYYNYTQDAGLLINETLKKDYKKSQELWEHSLKQLRKFQLRQSSQFYGGNSMSEHLFNEVRNDDSYSVLKLRFLKSVISSVKFNRRNKHDRQEAIQQLYTQTVRALYDKYRPDSKTKAEANFLSIKELLDNDDLAQDIEIPFTCLLGNALRQSSGAELQKLENYLKNHDTYKNNTELILVSSYLGQYKKDNKTNVPNDLINHYSEYLKNDKVNLSIRFISMHKVLFNTLNNAAESDAQNKLFYQVCDLASQSKNTEHNYYYEQLLDRLFLIKNKNENWKKAAKQVVSLTEFHARNDPSSFHGHHNSYNENLLTLFYTFFKIDEEAKAKSYLNKSELRLKNRFETIWILILNDHIEEASQISKDNLILMDSPSNFWNGLRNLKIDDKIEKYFLSLEDKELAYLARVYYAFASKNKDLQLELVKKFEGLKLQNKVARKKLIEIFNSSDKTKKFVEKFNAELFDSTDPLPIIYSDNNQKNASYANYLFAGLAIMTQGDIEEVATKIKKASMDEDYDYQAENLVEAISSAYDQSLKSPTYEEDFEIKAKKLIMLGEKLSPICDHARDVEHMFFTTYILKNQLEGEKATNEWLKTFSDAYFDNLRSHDLIQCLNIFSKLYNEKVPEQATLINKNKSQYISLENSQFSIIFPSEESRSRAVQDISNQLSRNIKKLSDLKSFSPEFAAIVAKSNNGYKLWQLIDQQYRANKKIADANPFELTIDLAYKLIADYKTSSSSKMNSFLSRLDNKKLDANITYLANLNNKPDWLRELEVNLIYKKALNDKAEKCPDSFVEFYQNYFADTEILAHERLKAYYNNYSSFKQCPIIIDSIIPLFKQSSADSHVKNNAFHELLMLAMHYSPVGEHESTLNNLLKLSKEQPDLGSNKAILNQILLRDIKIRLNQSYENPENILSLKESYLSLIYHGKHQEFADLFSANWQKIKLFDSLTRCFLPSKEHDPYFTASIEKLASPELKLLAQAIYYNESKLIRKDFSFYRYNHTQGSGSKLDQVAIDFSKTQFTQTKIKQSIALLLMLRSKGREVAKDDVISFIKSQKLEEIMKQHKHHYRVAYSLYIRELIQTNQFKAAEETCIKINQLANRDRTIKNSCHSYLQEISTMLVKEITEGKIKVATPNEWQQLKALAEAMLKSNDHPYHFASLLQLLSVSSTLEDKPEEALLWLNKMTPKYQKRFSEYELYKILNKLNEWNPRINADNLTQSQVKVIDSPACKLMFKKRKNEIVRLKNRLKLK